MLNFRNLYGYGDIKKVNIEKALEAGQRYVYFKLYQSVIRFDLMSKSNLRVERGNSVEEFECVERESNDNIMRYRRGSRYYTFTIEGSNLVMEYENYDGCLL